MMNITFDDTYENSTVLLFVSRILFYGANRLIKKIVVDSFGLIVNHGGHI